MSMSDNSKDKKLSLEEIYKACENVEDVKLVQNYWAEEIRDRFNEKVVKESIENTYLIDKCD